MPTEIYRIALPTQTWPNNQKQNEIKIKVGQQQENYEMT